MMQSDAVLSTCKRYRYTLTRQWIAGRPWCLWCMLNPSTADAQQDDPTIRRCIGFAARFGFGGIQVVNLFAYRATEPAQLATVADPVGPVNDSVIVSAASGAGVIVAAWGVADIWQPRVQAVLDLLHPWPLKCLGRTKGGHPRHPLYVPAATVLEDFRAAA